MNRSRIAGAREGGRPARVRRVFGIVLAGILAGSVAGCGWATAGNGSGLPPTPTSVAPQPTLQFLQTNVFNAICAACHVGATAPQGLKLDGNNPCLNLVCVPSVEVPALQRVQPGDPDNSYTIRKLEGTQSVGIRMPANGPPFLDQATIDVVRQWITDGAECESAGGTTPSCATLPRGDDEGPWTEALQPWLSEAGRQARRIREAYHDALQHGELRQESLTPEDRDALALLDLAARPGCPWFLGIPGANPSMPPEDAAGRKGCVDTLLDAVAHAAGKRDPAASTDAFSALARVVALHGTWHASPPASTAAHRVRLARLLHGVASLRVLPASPQQAVARSGFLLHLLASDVLSPDVLPWLDGSTPLRPAPGLLLLAWALDAAARGITVEPR